MSQTITVNARSPQPQLLGGPIAVQFIIANTGPATVNVLLPYPNPNNLVFRCETRNFAEARVVEREEIERTAPTLIPAGTAHSTTYYLGRYFKFATPGKGVFSFELRMPVWSENGPGASRDETFKGSFEVQLAAASDDQVRRELATLGSQLREKNRTRRLEAAEAMAFVDSPLVIPHLLAMLRIEGLEVIGIHALGLHRSPEGERAIISSLGSPDSAVVSAALEEIDRLKIPVPRPNVQRLLASDNPGIQWLALGWLSAKPNRQDLPLLIPLAQGGKDGIRERARQYMEKLESAR